VLSQRVFSPVIRLCCRFFPSTKLCSGRGYNNDSLSLSDREWTGPACATHPMRDFNSAKNVKSEGLKIVAAGYPETLTLVDCESAPATPWGWLYEPRTP
jgi:putative transposase